jgi:NADH-quinone oxidoreductase subunit N
MNWIGFAPEMVNLLAVVVFLGLALAPANPRRDFVAAMALSLLGLAVSLAVVRATGELPHQGYRADLFAQVYKILLAGGLVLVVAVCRDLADVEARRHPEFFLLLFTCNLAMTMLVSAVHLLAVYLALELSSYALYVLVVLRRDRELGVEAALKYFLVGVVASAVTLFGFALLYAVTRATTLDALARALVGLGANPLAAVGLLLTLGGFFFKLAVFPFHFWAPDVYQGAVHQVGAYIATVSKVAAMGVLLRLTALTHAGGPPLVTLLAVLAMASMTVGNLAAIGQQDLKRLLACSSVAHGGYVLIGLLSFSPAAHAAVMFYALGVLLMKFTCFLVVVTVAGDGRNPRLEDLAGLHARSPVLALALMMALFGLAGIPPTIGFTGKLLVFKAAVDQGHLALVIFAMLNVVVSLYYYLLVLKAAYLAEPAAGLPPLRVPRGVPVLAAALACAMVAIGFFPAPVIRLALAAAAALG